MNIIIKIQQSFIEYLQKTFAIDEQLAGKCTFSLNIDPLKQQFGDLSTNAAMVLAKTLQKNPRELAQQIKTEFKHPAIEKLEIAGPGFINAYLTHEAFVQLAQELFEQKENFFKPDKLKPTKYILEFVSANPTGPLHVGHGRNAILG
ncbi:unnamed protein product, partial [marine sediment metagenome]